MFRRHLNLCRKFYNVILRSVATKLLQAQGESHVNQLNS
jgi:hypothetical protein